MLGYPHSLGAVARARTYGIVSRSMREHAIARRVRRRNVMAERPMSFFVKAVWDAEAGVFYSDSNIIGLHIEAETIEEFCEIMADLAPELILANRP